MKATVFLPICAPVQVIASDLDRLEADIKSGDLAFIAAARAALAEGYTIYYNSWW